MTPRVSPRAVVLMIAALAILSAVLLFQGGCCFKCETINARTQCRNGGSTR